MSEKWREEAGEVAGRVYACLKDGLEDKAVAIADSFARRVEAATIEFDARIVAKHASKSCDCEAKNLFCLIEAHEEIAAKLREMKGKP